MEGKAPLPLASNTHRRGGYILAKRDLGRAPTVSPSGLADLPSMSRDSLYLCSLLYEKPFYLAVPVALHSLFSEKPHGERQGRGQNLPTAL